jgi:hypothetical protein
MLVPIYPLMLPAASWSIVLGFELASWPEGNKLNHTNGEGGTAEIVLAEGVRRLALYVAWAVTAEAYVTLAEELARCRPLWRATSRKPP